MKNLEFGIPYPVKIGIFNYFLEIRDVVTRHETRRLCESHTHTYRYIYQSCLFIEYFVFHDRALWTLFLTHFSFSLQQLEKQLSFTPSVQLLLLTNSLFSADRTEYPDAGAEKQENNQKERATGSGEDAVMTSSSERRKQDGLLTNWRKETTLVQRSTCTIIK